MIKMPCFYYIGRAETVEVLAEAQQGAPKRSNGNGADPSAIKVSRKPPVPRPVPEADLKEKERIVSENGVLHREYIFSIDLREDSAAPLARYRLRYWLSVARRYYALLTAAVVLPLGAAAIGAYAIALPSTSIGDRFLVMIAALAFGPPLVLAIRQLFIDEMRSYLRDSAMNIVLLAVIILAPVIVVTSFLIVTSGVSL